MIMEDIKTLESNILLDIYFYQKELEAAKTKDEKLSAQDNIKKAEELLKNLKSSL